MPPRRRRTFPRALAQAGSLLATRRSSTWNCPPRATDTPRDFDDVTRERAWGLKAFEALRSYFQVEDPATVAPGEER